MVVPARKTRRSKSFVCVALGLFAAGSLCAFQFGDRYELNGTPYAQVQALAADLPKAKALAQQGNIDLFAEAPISGRPVRLRGEITDANCYLSRHAHGYDHAFCAKLCAANGSSLLFVTDDNSKAYVVLTAKNAVRLPDEVLDQIGVPGILVRGQVLEPDGVRTLAIEDLAH
jgi:hypothetical protein